MERDGHLSPPTPAGAPAAAAVGANAAAVRLHTASSGRTTTSALHRGYASHAPAAVVMDTTTTTTTTTTTRRRRRRRTRTSEQHQQQCPPSVFRPASGRCPPPSTRRRRRSTGGRGCPGGVGSATRCRWGRVGGGRCPERRRGDRADDRGQRNQGPGKNIVMYVRIRPQDPIHIEETIQFQISRGRRLLSYIFIGANRGQRRQESCRWWAQRRWPRANKRRILRKRSRVRPLCGL